MGGYSGMGPVRPYRQWWSPVPSNLNPVIAEEYPSLREAWTRVFTGRDFTQARSTYHVHHSPRTPRGQPYGDLRMTGVLIKGAVPSVDSGWMVLPQSLRSGVFTYEEIATAPRQWCRKDRPKHRDWEASEWRRYGCLRPRSAGRCTSQRPLVLDETAEGPHLFQRGSRHV